MGEFLLLVSEEEVKLKEVKNSVCNYGSECVILLTPLLKESRSSSRTSSEENNQRRVERVLIILYASEYLSESKRVHVTNVSCGSFKV